MVFLNSDKTGIFAVFNNILTDFRKSDNKSVYCAFIIMKMFGKDDVGAPPYHVDNKVDIIGLHNRGDFEENVGMRTSEVPAGKIRGF